MAQFGLDKQRFPSLAGDMFDCPICTNVVVNPKECLGCGDLFCGRCIDDWLQKTKACPKRCPANNIQKMGSKALEKIYFDLDVKCIHCQKIVKLYDLKAHEQKCSKPVCENHDICSGTEQANKAFGPNICSQQCRILSQIIKTKGDYKKMYQILSKFQPKSIEAVNQYPNQSVVSQKSGSGLQMKWNQSNCGTGLTFQSNRTLVLLRQAAYVFRTAITSQGFNGGVHYWEISPDSRTQNQLKIGVSTSSAFDLNTAFCDHVFGFAYYGLGQLRHGSNASGSQYGKRLKKQGVLGVYLDMNKGQLSFSLNGQSMGVAFDNVALKKGPIYPAVALLHTAGCTIKGELPIPACFR